MKKNIPILLVALLLSVAAYGQVDIDRSINLTNATPADAKITGIKQVSASQDAVSVEALQRGSLVYATGGGTGSAYTVTLAPAISGYTDGMEVRFKAPAANAAGVTLNVNGVGAKTIKKNVTVNLAANDITAGQLVCVVYESTADVFQLVSRIEQLSNTTASGTFNNVTVNTQGLVTGGSNVAYLTSNQNITLSSDVTGSGTTAITATVARINGATLGSTTPTGGNLLIGSGTQWVSTALSGDATLSAAGALTISQNSNNYIKNTTTAQTADFNVNGTGRVGSKLTAAGSIDMTNGTSNLIAYNTAGVAAPSFTTRSAGTKIVLYPELSATLVDYALGIQGNTLWYSIPNSTSSFQHMFYAGTTELMRIRGDGNVGIGTPSPATKLNVHATAIDGVGHLLVNRGNSGGLGGELTIGNRVASAAGNASAIAFELDNSTAFNTSTGAAESNAEIRAAITNAGTGATDLFLTNWSGSAEIEGMRIKAGGNIGIGTPAPLAKVDIRGAVTISNGNNYANTNGNMALGSLTVGDINADFGNGNGWNANTAGLLLECKDNTEIGIHDSGNRIASAMSFVSSTNRLTVGRDMGWGKSDFAVSTLTGTGNRAVYADANGVLKTYSPSLPRPISLLSNSPGFPSGTYSFTTQGGPIMLFVGGSGYSGAGAKLIGVNIIVDGTTYGQSLSYTNEALSHKAFCTNYLVITGLAAGTHNLTFSNYNSTSYDSNDFFSATVIEFAP